MNPRLTNEQRRALERFDGDPVPATDDATKAVYLQVAKEQFEELSESQLRGDLQLGFDQADRGDVGDWDADAVRREAHCRHDAFAK